MKLIMVRHGETEENLNRIVQGHKPGKLTKNGREQARKLALRLKNEEIDVIFSSDLQRAKDTTKEIARFHKVPVYYTAELREMCSGILEGKPAEERDKAWNESGLPISQFKAEKGESFIEVRQRAQRFLDNIFKKYKSEIRGCDPL